MTLITAVVVAALSAADGEDGFERLRGAAEVIPGLSVFLGKYVGDCPDQAGPDCARAADEYRKKHQGKTLYLSIEDPSPILRVASKGPGEGECILDLTPFFSAAGYALTSGAPRKMDSAGNPVVGLMRVRGQAPDGDVDRLARLISMRQLRLEVLFTPEGTWKLAKKGGGFVQGVKAKLRALRVTMARTGEVVAVWTPR
jgi:hypothetical protein